MAPFIARGRQVVCVCMFSSSQTNAVVPIAGSSSPSIAWAERKISAPTSVWVLTDEWRRDLALPDFQQYAIEVEKSGTTYSEATRVLGVYLRDVIRMNPDNFRMMGPDETVSNRLGAVLEIILPPPSH
jgi:D-xylulose 5-phosphate/D-fructose 6-phosphate phosphoketolase